MEVKIKLKKNGPYLISGPVALIDSEGTEYGLGGRDRISLCGCGESESKPFCDGSHNRVGFKCERVARDLSPLG